MNKDRLDTRLKDDQHRLEETGENMFSQLNVLDREISRVQSEVELFFLMEDAAVIIQWAFRSHWKFVRREVRDKSARKIQCCFRGYKFSLILKQVVLEKKKISSAIAIQSYFRRRRFRRVVENDGRLSRVVRVWKSLRMKREDRAALKYGLKWRHIVWFLRFKREECRKKNCAVRIQRWWRTTLENKRFGVRANLASLRIQGLWKGRSQKRNFQRVRKLILLVQTRWRGFVARRLVRRLLMERTEDVERIKELEFAKAFMRKNWADERYKEVVVRRIQNKWRLRVIDMKLAKLRERSAAIDLQRFWRKRDFEKENKKIQENSLLKIQSIWRGRACRFLWQKQKKSMSMIQIWWRSRMKINLEKEKQVRILRMLVEKDSDLYKDLLVRQMQMLWTRKVWLKKRRLAADKISSVLRGRKMRVEFVSKKFLIEKIQRIWRGFVARQKASRMRQAIDHLDQARRETEILMALMEKDTDLYKDLLVRKIQAIWRAKILLRKVHEEEEKRLLNMSVIKIQSMFRGVQVRRQMEDKRLLEILGKYSLVSEEEDGKKRLITSSVLEESNKGQLSIIKPLILPEDLNGILRHGRLVSDGPLNGRLLSSLNPQDWEEDEVDFIKIVKIEKKFDVHAAAMKIQFWWRNKNINTRADEILLKDFKKTHFTRILEEIDEGYSGGGGFDEMHVRKDRVDVSQRGRVVSVVLKNGGKKDKRVVFSRKPLKIIPRRANPVYYFEVAVLDLDSSIRGFEGLTVGVTTCNKNKLKIEKFPDTCDCVEEGQVWAVGFDGKSYDSVSGEFRSSPFKPGRDLSKGDRIGCMVVFPDGDLLVLLNDEIVAEGPSGIPSTADVYGLVDMMGNVTSIEWRRLDSLPEISQMGDHNEYQRSLQRKSWLPSSSVIETNLLNNVSTLSSKEESELIKNDDNNVNTTNSASSSSLYPGYFRFDPLSIYPDKVVVSMDKTFTQYIADKDNTSDNAGGGVVMSERAIREFNVTESGDKENHSYLYFEVEVLDVKENAFTDGLTLGYADKKMNTSRNDGDFIETCDCLPGNVWAIGFDGRSFDSRKFTKIDWTPTNLKMGDKVGCMIVYPDGDLLLLVNGEIIAEGPSGIPGAGKGKESGTLYAVVDLIGNCNAVKVVDRPRIPVLTLSVD